MCLYVWKILPLIPFLLRETSGFLLYGYLSFSFPFQRLASSSSFGVEDKREEEEYVEAREEFVAIRVGRLFSVTCRRQSARSQVVCFPLCRHGLAEQCLAFLSLSKPFAWYSSICLAFLI